MPSSNKNNIATLITLAISVTSVTPGAVSAMGFFDADAQKTVTSAKMTVVEQETPTASVAPQVIELPDKLNTLVGSLENEQDVKVYSFKVVRGQRVVVHDFNWRLGDHPWLFEVKVNDTWAPVYPKAPVALPNVQPGQVVQLKISNNPRQAFKKGEKFNINFGSEPSRFKDSAEGDAPQIPISYGYTRAYKLINWSVEINDSTGHPLEGATAIIRFAQGHGV